MKSRANVKKKSLKKIKYWETNGGFKFRLFFNVILKMVCFITEIEYGKSQPCFLALWTRKLRDTLNKWKTKFALTFNIQKVIQALTFRSREKFDNSFLFKIVAIVW